MELALVTIELFEKVHLIGLEDFLSQYRHAIVFGHLCDICKLAFLRLMLFRLRLQAIHLILDTLRPLRVQFDRSIHLSYKLIKPVSKRLRLAL